MNQRERISRPRKKKRDPTIKYIFLSTDDERFPLRGNMKRGEKVPAGIEIDIIPTKSPRRNTSRGVSSRMETRKEIIKHHRDFIIYRNYTPVSIPRVRIQVALTIPWNAGRRVHCAHSRFLIFTLTRFINKREK